jgi:hypothetical protein
MPSTRSAAKKKPGGRDYVPTGQPRGQQPAAKKAQVGRLAKAAAAIRQQRAAEAAPHTLPVAVKLKAAPTAQKARGGAGANAGRPKGSKAWKTKKPKTSGPPIKNPNRTKSKRQANGEVAQVRKPPSWPI